MQTLLQDLRYGARMLAQKPGFTLVAAITLALGIGANTAIFSVVNAVLLSSLPFDHPETLVRVTGDLNKRNVMDVGLSVPELFDYRDAPDLFENISGLYPINVNLTGGDQPERIETLLVDVNYFDILGVKAQLGRTFLPEDYNPGNAELCVISDALWRQHFGADPNVLGKTLRLDNDPTTIVGVMPPRFRHPGRTLQSEVEIWSPSGWVAPPFNAPNRGAYFLQGALARLKPGVTVAAAQARMESIGQQLREQYPNDYLESAGWAPRLTELQDDLVGNVRPALFVILIAVGAVLLIACTNVASLLLARASARQREIAIRCALGAGRSQIIRQLLTESLLLAVIGGVLGILLAYWGTDLIVALSPTNILRFGEVGLDGRVLVFTFVISIATGIIFGLAPAIQFSKPNLQETLRSVSRSATAPGGRERIRSSIVVLQFALTLILMIAAALLIRSFWQLQNTNTGFSAKNILTASLWLPLPNQRETGPYFQSSRRISFYREVIERVSALPGVERVGGVSLLPLAGRPFTGNFGIEGRTPEAGESYSAQSLLATPDYFETLGISLIKGRLFTLQDDQNRPGAAIINVSLAERYFPGEDPIGKRIRFGGPGSQAPWLTVIGIVHDVKTEGIEFEDKPQIYRSVFQSPGASLSLVARTSSDAATLSEAVRREVRAADPDMPVYAVRSIDEIVAAALGRQRFTMILLGAFASVALFLSAVGIYGVTSWMTSLRTREIGIRRALGAGRGDVLKLIISRGMKVSLIGVTIGLAGAMGLTRLMTSLLYGVSATDPLMFAGVALLLALVALVACYIPARRATKVDPLIALRYE